MMRYDIAMKKEELIARMPKEVMRFSGRGRVWSYATVYDAPERFEDFTPYTVAIVELDEGVRVTAMLTDVDNKDVYIGMVVEEVMRFKYEVGDRGMKVYGYKFRPPIPKSTETSTQTSELSPEGVENN